MDNKPAIQCHGCQQWFPSVVRVNECFLLCSWCWRGYSETIARLQGIPTRADQLSVPFAWSQISEAIGYDE